MKRKSLNKGKGSTLAKRDQQLESRNAGVGPVRRAPALPCFLRVLTAPPVGLQVVYAELEFSAVDRRPSEFAMRDGPVGSPQAPDSDDEGGAAPHTDYAVVDHAATAQRSQENLLGPVQSSPAKPAAPAVPVTPTAAASSTTVCGTAMGLPLPAHPAPTLLTPSRRLGCRTGKQRRQWRRHPWRRPRQQLHGHPRPAIPRRAPRLPVPPSHRRYVRCCVAATARQGAFLSCRLQVAKGATAPAAAAASSATKAGGGCCVVQ